MRLGFTSDRGWTCCLCGREHEDGRRREALLPVLMLHLRQFHQRVMVSRRDRLGPKDRDDPGKPRVVVLSELHGVRWGIPEPGWRDPF